MKQVIHALSALLWLACPLYAADKDPGASVQSSRGKAAVTAKNTPKKKEKAAQGAAQPQAAGKTAPKSEPLQQPRTRSNSEPLKLKSDAYEALTRLDSGRDRVQGRSGRNHRVYENNTRPDLDELERF